MNKNAEPCPVCDRNHPSGVDLGEPSSLRTPFTPQPVEPMYRVGKEVWRDGRLLYQEGQRIPLREACAAGLLDTRTTTETRRRR